MYPVRLAVVAAIGALVAWLLFVFLAKAAHPYLLGYTEEQTISAMRERVALQAQRNEALQKRVDFLQTSEGVETIARHNGYHKPGEHVYLLPTDESAGRSPGILNATNVGAESICYNLSVVTEGNDA